MGVSKKSLQNLHPPAFKFGQPKRQRSIAVTEDGWSGFKEIAAEYGLSMSDLLEKIARRQITLGECDHERD